MDFNKLKKTIQEKSSVSEFLSATGMSESNYYKLLKSKSIKVDTLEKFSSHIGVPMSYWWEDEDKTETNYQNLHKSQEVKEEMKNYGEMIPAKIVERMMDHMEEEINHLKDEINELRGAQYALAKTGD